MIAETAYNVLQALSEKERQRFYQMLGVVPAKLGKPNRQSLTDEEATEYLVNKINKKR